MQARAVEAPQELEELTGRVERLHRGDPDMILDELQAAIEKAEEKRRELQEQYHGLKSPAKRSPSRLVRQNSIAAKSHSGLERNPQSSHPHMNGP